jgi:hypothetical protein
MACDKARKFSFAHARLPARRSRIVRTGGDKSIAGMASATLRIVMRDSVTSRNSLGN